MSGYPDRAELSRDDLERAFQALERRLAERGVRAHLYVVGGAAMAMAYRRSRTTIDVDELTIDHREAVMEAAADVARDLGLESGWLSDEVRTAVPVVSDAAAKTLFSSPHLVVTGASEAHMLAMKVHAGREADAQDIRWLLRRLGVRTMSEVEDIHRLVFPDSDIPRRAWARVGRLVDEVRDQHIRRWLRRGRSEADPGL